MKYYLLFFLICISYNVNSQNRNSVWCFGDSAGIDFSSGSAMPISSGMDGRGSCASIADSSGNLLFYAATMYTYAQSYGYATFVYNANHTVMINGDSIFGQGWYQELVIVPNPANDSTYYLLSIGVNSLYGLKYAIIDMRLNGGLGAVTQKNITLKNYRMADCLSAIKHGNGRDWWLIFRRFDGPTTPNNNFYSYLITPNGIHNYSIQSIGTLNRTDIAHISFSPNGDKLVFSNYVDLIEMFDFDRCTGQLSNPVVIHDDPLNIPYNYTWGCEFSPDGSKLYVSTDSDTCYLFQYDLNAPNISLTRDTIWSTYFPKFTLGALKLAPDNKIYLCNQYYNGFNNPYPYTDSVYNMYNMNLSVINQPDSLGSSCDFQPYSFYLGGKRAYIGLPNNPDYDMPSLFGSPCDTLVGISETSSTNLNPQLNIFYHPGWQTAFINAQGLKGNYYRLRVYDIQGKEIFSECGKLNQTTFTKNLNCAGYAKCVYMVRLTTEKENVVRKFVIE